MTSDSTNNSNASNGASSDEELVAASQAGDESALNILFERYAKPLWGYLARTSFFAKDTAYLDDLAQDILVIVFEEIKSGKFVPAGAGSFKGWLYTVAHLETLRHDKQRRRTHIPISQLYPEEPTGIPDDILAYRPTETKDYEGINQRLNEVLSQLSLEEQKLMRLVSQGEAGEKYKPVLADPFFSQYSLEYLMRKVYLIRQKIARRLKQGGAQ
jgi:RNA polymerase sigma factor (sigma-70 family)